MIIRVSNHADRIRLIAIENMKGAFGNGGALRFLTREETLHSRREKVLRTVGKCGHGLAAVQSLEQNSDDFWPPVSVEVW